MQEQCDIDQMNSSFETVVGEDSRSSDAILIEQLITENEMLRKLLKINEEYSEIGAAIESEIKVEEQSLQEGPIQEQSSQDVISLIQEASLQIKRRN